MKIHAYLLCFNEEAIIQLVLNYYSAFCSRIFLLDNFSTDSSVEIASAFPKVKVLQWSSDNTLNDYRNIEVKQTYYKLYSRQGGSNCNESADWVITCDMDELIYHPSLLKVLGNYKKNGVTVANIAGFNMVSAKEPEEISDLVTEVRTGVRAKVFDKPILFDPEFDMLFSPGCHPSGQRFEQMKQQPGYNMGGEVIALLHYKFIGQRFVEKAKLNASRLSSNNLRNNLGWHYQKTVSGLKKKNYEMRLKARQILDSKGGIID